MGMNLDESQRKKVAGWVSEGLKLSEIQNRLASELGVKLTYMEVRLLVDDLKLTPKDPELPKPSPTIQPPGAAAPQPTRMKPEPAEPEPAATSPVDVSVDQIAVPGAVVSGRVTFSDGVSGTWQFDEMGRLRLAASKAGYRPSAADLQQFQAALDNELRRMGL